MSTVLIFGRWTNRHIRTRFSLSRISRWANDLKLAAGIIGTGPNMITSYMVSIYEYTSNSTQTLATECTLSGRFLSSLTNMRVLLCRPVSERIWNRGGPSCETLVFRTVFHCSGQRSPPGIPIGSDRGGKSQEQVERSGRAAARAVIVRNSLFLEIGVSSFFRKK